MDSALTQEEMAAIEAELSLAHALRVLREQVELLEECINYIKYKDASPQMHTYRAAVDLTFLNIATISQKASDCFRALCVLNQNPIT